MLAVFSIVPPAPTAPLADNAPVDRFSAERAAKYLTVIAREPHSIGTPAHDRVRDFLLDTLRGLGATPVVHKADYLGSVYPVAATVENILVRLPGTAGRPNEAVLLMAHYDSVPSGPGAGDDGSGVVTLLETLRALKTGAPVRNDLIFLFSDGEEDGLLGAAAFMQGHPWAKDVKVALNFEARGNAGAPSLFETSRQNGPLIRTFAGAAPHPLGNSLTEEIYHHMPNDTDLSMVLPRGVAGLNFAFLGHWRAYHTKLDSAAALDRGSVQQQGEYALGLARAFGNRDDLAGQVRGPSEIFYSVPGGLFLHYGAGWALPLAGAVLLVVLALAVRLVRRSHVASVRQLLWGVVAAVGQLVLVLVVGYVYVTCIQAIHTRVIQSGLPMYSAVYDASLLLLLAAVWLSVYRRVAWVGLAWGSLLVAAVLDLVLAIMLPGGSYLLVLPVVAGAVALALAVSAAAESGAGRLVLVGLLAVPAMLTIAPFLSAGFAGLGFTVFGAMLSGLMVALLLGVLSPVLPVAGASSRLMPVGVLAAAVALGLYGLVTVRDTADVPRGDSLFYALDTVQHKAIWAADAPPPVDPWVQQLLTSSPRMETVSRFFPGNVSYKYPTHDAPVLPIAAPVAALTSTAKASDGGPLTMHIASPRHAPYLLVWTTEPIASASLNGRSVPAVRDAKLWYLRYINLPAEGIDLTLTPKTKGPLTLHLVDRSPGLPEQQVAPRPGEYMQEHTGDRTMVLNEVTFP